MLIGRVIGNMVSTIKDKDFHGHRLLMVEPLTPTLEKYRDAIIAVDVVEAGDGQLVLYVDEGNCGRQLLDLPEDGAIKAVIVGIIDDIDLNHPEPVFHS